MAQKEAWRTIVASSLDWEQAHSSLDNVLKGFPPELRGRRPKGFAHSAWELLEHRIHLLIIDPFPPGKRDPKGLHAEIWGEIEDESFEPPPGKPLTLVSYECELVTHAYIEPFAVGDILPDMPLFLTPEHYINVPLERTYTAAWEGVPERWRRVIEAKG